MRKDHGGLVCWQIGQGVFHGHNVGSINMAIAVEITGEYECVIAHHGIVVAAGRSTTAAELLDITEYRAGIGEVLKRIIAGNWWQPRHVASSRYCQKPRRHMGTARRGSSGHRKSLNRPTPIAPGTTKHSRTWHKNSCYNAPVYTGSHPRVRPQLSSGHSFPR